MRLIADLISFLRRPADVSAASADDLRVHLAALNIPALEAENDRLEASRRPVLLRGDDAALAELDAKIRASNIACERAAAIAEELTRLIAEAEAREAAQATSARRAEAERLTRAAIAGIRKDLPKAYAAVREVLRKIAEAEAACAAVNAGLPSDQHVVGPEAWRREPELGETVISDEVVALWADSAGNPLPEAQQRLVRSAGDGTFILPTTDPPHPTVPTFRSAGIPVSRRQFRKVTRLPAAPSGIDAPLAASLVLPPVRAGEPPGWAPVRGWTSPADIIDEIERIEADLAGSKVDERRPIVTLTMVADMAEAA